MAFPRYELYRDSGVDWLGEIPAEWSLETIRAVTQLKSEKGQPDLQVLSVYRDYGVIPKDSREDNHNATSLDTAGYKVVSEGDLVVNKMKTWQGSMGISEHKGIVSPAYITCKVNSKRVFPKFLHYLLRSQSYIGVYNALSYGVRVGQWDMHYEDFKHIPLPLPDRVCQERIANFLDQKTAEIEEAIAKKQRLIELLKEQKAILINQAVTKGLNPGVPMRDSGVEWIGEVPAHWETTRLKFATKFIVDCLHATPRYDENGEFPAIRTADVVPGKVGVDNAKKLTFEYFQKWVQRAEPVENDILYSREGERYGIAAPVPKGVRLCISQRMMHFRTIQKINPQYLMWQLNCQHVYSQASIDATGATSPHVNISTIRNFNLVLPPRQEQDLIVKYIEGFCIAFDEAVNKAENEMTLLVEYKTILMANTVTGKNKI